MQCLVLKQSRSGDRIERFTRILDLYPSVKRMLDLGAGHCSFSQVAAKRGINVTAVDSRDERVPNNIRNLDIEFIRMDINSLDFNPQGYDIICMLGILYHLTLDEQITLLKKCSYTTAIVDTHYSLRSSVKMKGYQGYIYVENDEIRKDLRSAWTSSDSFWHTLSSLEKLFTECGYRRIIKIEPELESKKTRSFFICEH